MEAAGDNEWVAALRQVLSLGRTLPTTRAGVPGPFGLADRPFTGRVLADAGFVDVTFDEVVGPIWLGGDADDAYSFVSTLGITRGLTQDLDDARKAAALDALPHPRRTRNRRRCAVRACAWLVRARTRSNS